VVLWDYAARRVMSLCCKLSSRSEPSPAALSPDERTLAIGMSDGSVILWDVVSDRQKAAFPVEASGGTVRALAFSPDGRRLATSSGDPAMGAVWDIASRKRIAFFEHGNAAEGVAFSPDGRTLAVADWHGKVFLWDLAANTQVSWQAHTKAV